MKKILLALLFIGLLGTSITNAAIIDNVNVIDNKTLQLSVSDDIIFSDIKVEGEIKVLKDRKVSFSLKDIENSKKVMLNLSSDLSPNTSYSLISILGTEGNIDFNIGKYIVGEILNDNKEEGKSGIEKINLVDSRTIEVYFTDEVFESEFEFKILSELNISTLVSKGDSILNVELSDTLNKTSDYILMVIFLKDALGANITFSEDLYDFTTGINLVEKVVDEEVIVATTEPEEVVVETGNIEEVALKTTTTPETGPTTSLLILFIFILNLIYFGRKRFIK